MNELKISVIIPTFKPTKFLFECLNSIEKQTFSKQYYEVIIVLNGPKENYISLVEDYLNNSTIINKKLIYTNQIGVSNARNIGIDNAQGENLCFIDDDDIVSLNYLNGLLKNTGKHGIVISNLKCFKKDLNNLKDDYISIAFEKFKNQRELQKLELRKFLSSSCAKLIPVDVINELRFSSKLKVSEDACFMFSISKNINIAYLADEDVIYYRRVRRASVSRSIKSNREIINDTFLFIKCLLKSILVPEFYKYNFILFFVQIGANIIFMLKKIMRK